jgi:phosphoglycolate phosphatase-like HAD superfamily hydrolase
MQKARHIAENSAYVSGIRRVHAPGTVRAPLGEAMTEVKALLLDLDGTLIDSNDAHAEAWVEVLKEFDHDVRFEQVRPLIGKGSDRVLPEVAGVDAESPEGKRIVERRTALFLDKYMPRLQPFPCTAALAQRMQEAGLKLVVATSANQKEMKELVRIAGIERFIDRATNASEAENSKPDPDIINAALTKAKVTPEHAMMLGDTPYDIEAASRAGVRTIAVRCGGWKEDALRGAVAIYADPCDLLKRYDESPLGRHR